MKKGLRILWIVIVCLLITSTAQASELAGMGEALLKMFVGGVVLIGALVFMFLYFIRDLKFIIFSLINIVIIFMLLSLVAGGNYFSEQSEIYVAHVLRLLFVLQIIAIAIAGGKKYKRLKNNR